MSVFLNLKNPKVFETEKEIFQDEKWGPWIEGSFPDAWHKLQKDRLETVGCMPKNVIALSNAYFTVKIDGHEYAFEGHSVNEFYVETLQEQGFDGITLANTLYDRKFGGGDQFVAFNSKQIKSADPVTYDDAGNVIPLSRRFDMTNPDIRY